MTVQSNLDLASHQMTWVLAVEGIGWPDDETDLSAGFSGHLFATSDPASDLASTFTSATVHLGLNLPGGISDTIDPVTLEYSAGGMTFDISDDDDWLETNIRPHGNSSVDNLNAALAYSATTIDIDEGGGVTFAEKDIAWLGGVEAVKLGSRSLVSGNVYRYTNSTRGALGTTRGKTDTRGTIAGTFTWPSRLPVLEHNPYWYGRRVMLLMHVPGEAAANILRVYVGVIQSLKQVDLGNSWTIGTRHEMLGAVQKVREGASTHYLRTETIVGSNLPQTGQLVNNVHSGTRTGGDQGTIPEFRRINIHWEPEDSDDGIESRALRFAYAYRSVPGGTVGATTAAVSTPQAETRTITFLDHQDTTAYMAMSLVSIGGKVVRLLWKAPNESGNSITYHTIIAEISNTSFATTVDDSLEYKDKVKYLLDNYLDGAEAVYNRFYVNGAVQRNIVNVVLAFLTSMNNEYFIGDATTGGSAAVIPFTAPGWTTNEWTGYALHCVEGPNKGEARYIISNGTATINVDSGFTSASHNGNEYQIRNSVLDILPQGWGLGVHNSRIDFESWHNVRDRYFPDTNVSDFAIGESERVDTWELLTKNILEPYGIYTYIDRTTGKLKARYIGETPQDGLIEDYTAVATTDMLSGGFNPIDIMPRPPVYQIVLHTRGKVGTIKPIIGKHTGIFSAVDKIVGYDYGEAAAAWDSDPNEVTITIDELDGGYMLDSLTKRTVTAMFNTVDQRAFLVGLLLGRVKRLATPPPQTSITLDISFLPKIQAGSTIAISDTTRYNPFDPYTGSRGWSGVVCLVIGTTVNLSERDPGMDCELIILSPITGGLIAPAAEATARVIHGSGTHGFTVNNHTYNPGTASDGGESGKDWHNFVVGDLIELHAEDGSTIETGHEIESFGANEVADPTAASTSAINVVGTISTTSYTSGDYITFSDWTTATNTTNMTKHVALADASELIDSDAARKYQ